MRELPSGTVTFLFTDVEGSTKLLHELGAEAYAEALLEHRRLLRDAFSAQGGVEVDTQGDAFFVAFPTASGALAAAAAALEGLSTSAIRVRMGVHTGTPHVNEEGYVGVDVHRAARIAAAGHGGQVLVSSATAALLPPRDDQSQSGFALRDLGEHRFKDLGAAERVYQLGEETFPPLNSLHRSNLPVAATPFLGRKRELGEAAELLTRQGVRLVTLTGPGGTGKTRLGLQAAAEVSDCFPDGVFWVALAPLRDVELVLSSVAFSVGLQEEPGRPLLEMLVARLAGRRVLLLLDNAEHLFPAVAEHVASVVASCPTVTVLVTSRQRLHISGEHLYAVPSLDEEEAEALFLVRAAEHGVSLEPDATIRQLCARLDALPLALELAAARTPLFSVEQLVERLGNQLDLFKGGRDVDLRQQTLRATIDWSYELLTPDEQLLFCALSVFAGGCTYEAAEQVADANPDTLLSLLDKSLVRRRDTEHGPRYWMLEAIREYAGERLRAGAGVGEVRRRFLDNALALAELLPFGSRERSWLQRVAAEHENIRVALLVEPVADGNLRLAAALIDYWAWSGHVSEGRSSLEKLLATARDISEETRARAECVAGFLAMLQDDHDRSEQLHDAASDVVDRLDMHADRVLVRMCRGFIAFHRGDLQTAEQLFREGLASAGNPGMEYLRPRLLRALSLVTDRKGDHDAARVLQEESLAAAHGTDELVQDLIRSDIAWRAVHDGDFEKARRLAEACLATPQLLSGRPDPALQHTLVVALVGLELYMEAEELARGALRNAWDRHDVQSGAALLDVLGALAADRGDDMRAGRLTAAAEGLLRRAGFSDAELEVQRSIYGSHLDVAQTRSGSAWETESRLGAATEFGAAVEYALADEL